MVEKSKKHVSKPEKIGAGLFLTHGRDVLLLLRNSANNDNTWGLPGGNCEHGETLYETAVREAQEELGTVPKHHQIESYLTKRGDHKEKHYTVFRCHVGEEIRNDYIPTLNHEHKNWKWFTFEEVMHMPKEDLHPVIRKLRSKHPEAFRVI